MKRSLALITLSLAAATAFATTYVRVEKDGTKTYSDRPLPGGQPIEIHAAQGYSAPNPAPAARGVPPEQQLLRDMGDAFHYESCALTPAADQTFTNPESVPIEVMLKPSLRAGDAVTLRLDGAPVGGTNALNYIAKPIVRGAHTIAVSVKDQYGRALCDATSTFHVFQPTVNSPARQTTPSLARPNPLPRPKGG